MCCFGSLCLVLGHCVLFWVDVYCFGPVCVYCFGLVCVVIDQCVLFWVYVYCFVSLCIVLSRCVLFWYIVLFCVVLPMNEQIDEMKKHTFREIRNIQMHKIQN